MAKLSEILNDWDKDSIIDGIHLDNSALSVPRLHSKYLGFLMDVKRLQISLTEEFSDLKGKKFRYFRGEMGREELASLEWNQWQGVKPLKNEMEQFLQGDPDLVKLTGRITKLGNSVYALESILTQIRNMGWSIKSNYNLYRHPCQPLFLYLLNNS